MALCGHHFEHSRSTLRASRALAFSLDGEHLTITTFEATNYMAGDHAGAQRPAATST